jgi:hypothetical protein
MFLGRYRSICDMTASDTDAWFELLQILWSKDSGTLRFGLLQKRSKGPNMPVVAAVFNDEYNQVALYFIVGI